MWWAYSTATDLCMHWKQRKATVAWEASRLKPRTRHKTQSHHQGYHTRTEYRTSKRTLLTSTSSAAILPQSSHQCTPTRYHRYIAHHLARSHCTTDDWLLNESNKLSRILSHTWLLQAVETLRQKLAAHLWMTGQPSFACMCPCADNERLVSDLLAMYYPPASTNAATNNPTVWTNGNCALHDDAERIPAVPWLGTRT